MRSMTKHLLSPAAIFLFAGCLVEVTPEPSPPPPPPPPGVVLDLQGQLFEASGGPAPFVPVRLGDPNGPVVATDENGGFVFPAVAAGQHAVYAFDRFAQHIAFAEVALAPGSEDVVMQLKTCTDIFDGGVPDPALQEICYSDMGIDLPPDSPDVSFGDLKFSEGSGSTNAYNTSAAVEFREENVRMVFFSLHDGLGRGGVREFTMVNHRLLGADPGSDPFGEPIFYITVADTHGHQNYSVRDGVFRLELEEGSTPRRSYILTGTDLVLDYGEPRGPWDPAYTLTVPLLRLEGTLDVDLPPPPPAGDIDLELVNPFGFAYYPPGRETLGLSYGADSNDESIGLRIASLPLPLPGTVTVELPIGDAPDLQNNTLSLRPDPDSPSAWNFQLVSYTLSTEMTELPGCNEQLQITLENLVFRYATWDYDENSDRVDHFGDQTLTIDRLDIDVPVFYEEPNAC